MKVNRKPDFLKPKKGDAQARHAVKRLLRASGLHTVCESAQCPNIGECFGAGTATFLILGDVCSRNCAFCAVKKGTPKPIDLDEPERVAEAAQKFALKHVVITSVTRDDLEDGGAGIFAETVKAVRKRSPDSTVEILIPDFNGNAESLETVFAVKPDTLNHNVETVPRLYPSIRPQADWKRSLGVLQAASKKGLTTKSGIMLGLGEEAHEIESALRELRGAGCDMITIGQYLAPSRKHVQPSRFVAPDEFDKWREFGTKIGFKDVFSAPLVRSSYHAKSKATG